VHSHSPEKILHIPRFSTNPAPRVSFAPPAAPIVSVLGGGVGVLEGGLKGGGGGGAKTGAEASLEQFLGHWRNSHDWP
jgi:hypothetical protein